MKTHYWVIPLLFSAAGVLTGCMSEADAEPSDGKPVATTITAGDMTVTGLSENRKVEVYQDQDAFNAALYNFMQPIAEETIDFSTNQVVLLSLGEVPSGGYSIAVTGVEDNESYVKVSVLYSSPGSNCAVTTVISSPYLFAKIDTKKTLIFEESIDSKPCNG